MRNPPHRRWSNGVLAALLLAWTVAAHAASPAARALAAGCASCHQPTEPTPPSLLGQSRAELIARLRAFRDGTREGTVMPQIVKGYTDAELEACAAYFAARSASP